MESAAFHHGIANRRLKQIIKFFVENLLRDENKEYSLDGLCTTYVKARECPYYSETVQEGVLEYLSCESTMERKEINECLYVIYRLKIAVPLRYYKDLYNCCAFQLDEENCITYFLHEQTSFGKIDIHFRFYVNNKVSTKSNFEADDDKLAEDFFRMFPDFGLFATNQFIVDRIRQQSFKINHHITNQPQSGPFVLDEHMRISSSCPNNILAIESNSTPSSSNCLKRQSSQCETENAKKLRRVVEIDETAASGEPVIEDNTSNVVSGEDEKVKSKLNEILRRFQYRVKGWGDSFSSLESVASAMEGQTNSFTRMNLFKSNAAQQMWDLAENMIRLVTDPLLYSGLNENKGEHFPMKPILEAMRDVLLSLDRDRCRDDSNYAFESLICTIDEARNGKSTIPLDKLRTILIFWMTTMDLMKDLSD